MIRNTHSNQSIDHEALYDLEAEKAVLGSIIMHPDRFHNTAGRLKRTDFFDVRHGQIFENIAMLHDQKKLTIELRLLVRDLRIFQTTKDLEIIELQGFVEAAGIGTHGHRYANLVRNHAMRRQMQNIAMTMLEQASDQSIDLKKSKTLHCRNWKCASQMMTKRSSR